MDIKICTMTLSAKIPNCELNLLNIEKYLELDEHIIGIKSRGVLKGVYCTNKYKRSKKKKIDNINKESFYNQISIIINTNGNLNLNEKTYIDIETTDIETTDIETTDIVIDSNVNLKIFKNGSLHLTGCKSKKMAEQTIKILLDKLYKMSDKNVKMLLTKDENNVLLDNVNMIYSYDDYKTIGYVENESKREKTYVINNKSYKIDEKTGMFISCKKYTTRQYDILNLSGKQVGFCQIVLTKGNKKFYNRNVTYDYENGLIYNKHLIIGNLEYSINKNEITNPSTNEDIYEITHSCNPFANTNIITNTIANTIENTEININCINVSFNINTVNLQQNIKINREKLYNTLIKDGYICKFKPETYSGIKLIYKVPYNYDSNDMNSINGICNCSNKCTCYDVIFLIFQTGNVLATGIKDEKIIEPICNKFLNLYKKYSENNIQKTII